MRTSTGADVSGSMAHPRASTVRGPSGSSTSSRPNGGPSLARPVVQPSATLPPVPRLMPYAQSWWSPGPTRTLAAKRTGVVIHGQMADTSGRSPKVATLAAPCPST